jgi:hypothetical protein
MFPLLPGTGFDAGHPSVPFEEKRIIRRGAPDALRFHTPAPGPAWPPSPLVQPVSPEPQAGGGWGWLTSWLQRAPRGAPTAAPAR